MHLETLYSRVYFSNILSMAPEQYLKPLKVVQKKALRIVCGKNMMTTLSHYLRKKRFLESSFCLTPY